MKIFLFLTVILLLTISADKCGKKKSGVAKYKARLETKALCMNYTLKLIEGEMDTSLVTPDWTDESTGKSYTNVFGLDNPCDFPANIAQGDEFSFSIDTSNQEDCAVCMAYYPTPPKKLSIKVIEN